MTTFPVHFFLILVVLGATFDIAANFFLKKSNGFKLKKWGICGIIIMFVAYAFLAVALTKLTLAVVYTLWMAFGMLGTALLGWQIFQQKLHISAWIGMMMLVVGIILIYIP